MARVEPPAIRIRPALGAERRPDRYRPTAGSLLAARCRARRGERRPRGSGCDTSRTEAQTPCCCRWPANPAVTRLAFDRAAPQARDRAAPQARLQDRRARPTSPGDRRLRRRRSTRCDDRCGRAAARRRYPGCRLQLSLVATGLGISIVPPSLGRVSRGVVYRRLTGNAGHCPRRSTS